MLTTIITSAVVSLVVSLITLYLVQPITGQKQLIGEIDVATRQYSTAPPRVAEWRTQGEREAAKVKAEEATQELLRLSAQFGASPATFPVRGKYYRLLEPLVASRENVSKASSELTA